MLTKTSTKASKSTNDSLKLGFECIFNHLLHLKLEILINNYSLVPDINGADEKIDNDILLRSRQISTA